MANRDTSREYRPSDMVVINYPVYLYTSWEGLESIMTSGELKASRPSNCNDLYEFLPSWQTDEELQYIKQVLDHNEQLMFCFSRTPRSAPMWGHYADRGRGVVLQYTLPVFKIRAFAGDESGITAIGTSIKESIHDNELYMENDMLAFVNYSETRHPFHKVTDFRDYALFTSTKGLEWQYEKEVRIIMNSDDKRLVAHGGNYYTSAFNRYLTAIIPGPKSSYGLGYLNSFLDTVESKPCWKGKLKGKRPLLYAKAGIDKTTYIINIDEKAEEGKPEEEIPLTRSIHLGTKGIDVRRVI